MAQKTVKPKQVDGDDDIQPILQTNDNGETEWVELKESKGSKPDK